METKSMKKQFTSLAPSVEAAIETEQEIFTIHLNKKHYEKAPQEVGRPEHAL
jgi:hypothetical protein